MKVVFYLYRSAYLALLAVIANCSVVFPTLASVPDCLIAAASQQKVDPILLVAIGWQESRGERRAVGPLLPDGNRALGVMQINTIHLPELQRYGFKREDLFNHCDSFAIGAYVLRRCIDEFGNNWGAVGCYYGGPKSKAYAKIDIYIKSVQRYYAQYAKLLTVEPSLVGSQNNTKQAVSKLPNAYQSTAIASRESSQNE
jgi:soluble lytic murein transglycosylase-like protein